MKALHYSLSQVSGEVKMPGPEIAALESGNLEELKNATNKFITQNSNLTSDSAYIEPITLCSCYFQIYSSYSSIW